MKHFHIGLFAIVLIVLLASCAGGRNAAASGGLDSVRIMSDEYPRAFFFRSSEGFARNPDITYEEWDRTFSRLMGIMGKTLDEEVVQTQWRNVEFFTRFKYDHPEQIVLLHFNGNARDPRYEAEKFFAGHWLYFNGCKITADVPAEPGETNIPVEDTSLFRINIGRYRDLNEDIGLCALDENGMPDWRQSEQVQLVSVNPANKTIRVKRGMYGTKPMAFTAGKSYAAAHVQEGPWGRGTSEKKTALMWYYNFSPDCPRDAQGRTCSDVLVADVSSRFEPGGRLAAFDGLEFDVLRYQVLPHDQGDREGDSNNDTVADRGWIDGVNRYAIGVVEFCRRLRERFPQDKLLMADGMAVRNQRAMHILNGIESEGFPHLRDLEMAEWSGGMNRHLYWDQNARPPVFNYINHKFIRPDAEADDANRTPEVPFGIHRLSFAASVFTNAALCYSYRPESEGDELVGIWDELDKGTENVTGWLGKPLGPAVRVAERQPDLLGGAGESGENLAKLLSGGDVEIMVDGATVKIAGTKPASSETTFRMAGVRTNGPDLYVKLTARAAPRQPYPAEMARLLQVSVAGSPMEPIMTWVGQNEFTSSFYFNSVSGNSVDLEFAIEGPESLWLSGMTVHAHPDAIYRELEGGVVLANPSPRPYRFDLAQLFPGRPLTRLQGSSKQDPQTNNGSPASGELVLPAKDALFLVEGE